MWDGGAFVGKKKKKKLVFLQREREKRCVNREGKSELTRWRGGEWSKWSSKSSANPLRHSWEESVMAFFFFSLQHDLKPLFSSLFLSLICPAYYWLCLSWLHSTTLPLWWRRVIVCKSSSCNPLCFFPLSFFSYPIFPQGGYLDKTRGWVWRKSELPTERRLNSEWPNGQLPPSFTAGWLADRRLAESSRLSPFLTV